MSSKQKSKKTISTFVFIRKNSAITFDGVSSLQTNSEGIIHEKYQSNVFEPLRRNEYSSKRNLQREDNFIRMFNSIEN